jgi:LysR family nitrogen assimilation transcriptional regulator
VGEHAAGQLSVGVPPSWERVFTLPFAQKLSTTHPHVGLRLHEGVSNVLRDYMHAGLLDFCIVPFGEAQTQGYRQTRLVREQLLLVRKKDAGLRLDEPVALSSLDGLKLVLPSRPNALRVQVEHALERKGMTYAGGIETDTLALCLELTRLGLGVTVMPACTLYEYPHAEQFSWAPIRGQYLTWALYENLARTHSQAVREGRKMILSIVSEATDKKNWFSAQRV